MSGYGCRSDLRDARDYLWLPSPDDVIPDRMNLGQFMPGVLDQGPCGSCTAHGVTEALRFIIKKSGHPDRSLARLQLYYDSRAMEGVADVDAGATIRDVVKCARTIGVANEAFWSYDLRKLLIGPPPNVYEDAHSFEAITYQRVTIDPNHVKAAIATGYPVVIGLSLYDSFESDEVAKTGIVPMPNLQTEGVAGGHCMLVYGYGDRSGYFTVRNSWGPTWGDKGDCYIPESIIGTALYGADYWRITRTS